MPKTIKNSYNEKLTFIKLYKAYLRARKNKGNKREILLYNLDLETNLINLLNRLQDGSYSLGKYREFKIYEPKERIIKSLPFEDRIVHQWVVREFIKPYFIPRFINTSCACIDNRGTHYAVRVLQNYMRQMKRVNDNYYILKCDIRKFFNNINKDILYDILKKRISDKKLMSLIMMLIYDNNEGVGIPIGNYTSQYFANIYLNEIDWYIKKELGVKYLVRYMDDFVMLVKTKEDARSLKKKIVLFLNNKLKLELNPKSEYYPSCMGVNFCGYRIFETHMLLRENSKIKMKKKIKNWNKKYLDDNFDFNGAILSWNSWLAHSSHSNSYLLQQQLYERIIFNVLLKSA
jgi:retron-type reverse transcriptase